MQTPFNRRTFLATTTALVAAIVVRPTTLHAQDDALAALVRAYANGATIREGRVRLDIAPLVDNGNSVPIEVVVQSPMTARDYVAGIVVFNEKNPQREVAELVLSPMSGRARVATRIRLAMTQKIVAVARMSDGSCWTHTVDVLVTLAACIED